MKRLRQYLNNEFQSMQGWCIPQLWQSIEAICDFQKKHGIDGPIAEIGVYHGKFFIGLALSKESHQNNYAIDVFDLQQFNLDFAGKGDLEIFKANLDKLKVKTKIVKADSLSLSEDDIKKILKVSEGFSMFSVDGCHLPEHTVVDFQTAMKLTKKEGIIFIDDYNNPNWPGVQEGISKLFFNSYPTFVPLSFSCNKLAMCHYSYHDQYLKYIHAHVKKNFPQTRLKVVKRFGYDSLTIKPNFQSTDYLVAQPGA